MKKICFRVDASNSVGMGHLMECLALADFFDHHCEYSIIFLVNDFPVIEEILSKNQYTFHTLETTRNEEAELHCMSEFFQKNIPDVIVCDLLDRSENYYRAIHNLICCSVVILDDEIHRAVAGDIIVNFSITQDPGFYSSIKDISTRYCIGPAYMPLTSVFNTKWKMNKHIPEKCETIFLNQGGSDPFGLTAKIIRALELLELSQTLYVVIGDAISDRHRQELESMRPQLKNKYIFEWGVTHERMLEIMEICDVAITAAGNTLYELAIFGVPSIIICHHERHHRVAEKFAQRSAAINLGIGTHLDAHQIADSVYLLLNDYQHRVEMSQEQKKIIDGNGCKRITEEMKSLW